jgi:all-trans-retinol 13,14-reductase
MKFDAIIIGSGLGSLLCAYILSREGFSVCVLEKNNKFGGCLQTFNRDGSCFDTGMHYIGSMDDGQILRKYFNYFNLSQNLRLKRLDENGYDIIRLKKEEYKFANGYDNFCEKILQKFPSEKEAIKAYITKLQDIGNSVDLFNIRDIQGTPKYFDYYSQSFDEFINTITNNRKLKNVLLSISPLYAGRKDMTPLYIPMIIHASFIPSAYRFIDGGSQVSDILIKQIIDFGGVLFKRYEVTGFKFEKNRIKNVEVNHSHQIEGKYFIAGIHPKTLLSLIEPKYFKPAYVKRILSLEETTGMFSLYLSLHNNTFKYINSNLYCYDTDEFWEKNDYSDESWPQGFMIHFSPLSQNNGFTNAVIINTYMKWDDVKKWQHTSVEKRGDEYLEFKQKKAEILLSRVENYLPGIRKAIKSYYTSTPLTYRDYTGSYNGSVYGIQKDYHNSLKTMILPQTHIENLLLTGQNINIHGVVGVTLGSIITCSELLGMNYLIKKIRHAQ